MEKLNYNLDEFLEAIKQGDNHFIDRCKESKEDIQFIFNLACREGVFKIVEDLIGFKDIKVNHNDGYSLRWAVNNEHFDIIHILIQNGATLSVDNNCCLKYLLSQNSPFEVTKIFIKVVEIDKCVGEFQVAVMNKNIPAIEYFFDLGFRLPPSNIELVLQFLELNQLNLIERASNNNWLDLSILKNDIDNKISHDLGHNFSRLNSETFHWVLKKIPNLKPIINTIFPTVIWKNNIDLAEYLFTNYCDYLSSSKLYLFKAINNDSLQFILDNNVLKSVPKLELEFSNIFENNGLSDNNLLELFKKMNNSKVVVNDFNNIIYSLLMNNRPVIVKDILDNKLFDFDGSQIPNISPHSLFNWSIESISFLLELKGLEKYVSNQHVNIIRQIATSDKERIEFIAGEYHLSQIDLQIASSINLALRDLLLIRPVEPIGYSSFNVKQVFEGLISQINNLDISEETPVFETLTSALSKSELLTIIESIWLNVFYESGEPNIIHDIFSHFELDRMKISESLNGLMLNCHFKAVKSILLKLKENHTDAIGYIFKENKYTEEFDLFIGLVNSGQKEMMELLFVLLPNSWSWSQYRLEIISASLYHIQYLDFLLIKFDENDECYSDFVIAKIEWCLINNEKNELTILLNRLKSVHVNNDVVVYLDNKWSVIIDEHKFEFSTIIYEFLKKIDNPRSTNIIDTLEYYFEGELDSPLIYFHLLDKDLINSDTELITSLTKEHLISQNIARYKSISEIEKELRFSINSVSEEYLKQIFRSSIRYNNIDLTKELNELDKDQNMLDADMLLESCSPLLTKRLLDLNPEFSSINPFYFLKAISKGNTILIDVYLESGVNFRFKNDKGIILAAENGRIEIMKRLISLGCDVNTQNSIILSKTTSLTIMSYLINNYNFPQYAIKSAILYHCYHTEDSFKLINELMEVLKSKKILKLGFFLSLESKEYFTAEFLIDNGVNSDCFFGISKLYKKEFLESKNLSSEINLTGNNKSTYNKIFLNNYNLPLSLLRVLSIFHLARMGSVIQK